jgi:Tol biopolymer transport system component
MDAPATAAHGRLFVASLLSLITACSAYKTVTIESVPDGADLFVNGEPAGISPLSKVLEFAPSDRKHLVTARKDGYEDGTVVIELQPLDKKVYQIQLSKMEAVPLELLSVEPTPTEKGVRLVAVRKPTLAYLEDIERSPNVSSVTKVTTNEDPAIQIGPPVLSPTEESLLYWEFVEEEGGSTYSNIQKQKVDSFAKTRLTYGKYRDLFPTFTPDGRSVVFSSNRISENPTLWMVRADGPGGITKLTGSQTEDFSPCVAPDGKTVTYASNAPSQDETEIWTIGMHGSLSTQLRVGESPQISPDGARILFVRRDRLTGRRALWVMSIEGHGETQLTSASDYETIDPRWSPDGKWIVFASNEGRDSKGNRNFDIWMMGSDGSRATQLTTNGSWDDGPCWDSTGETIYFRSNRGNAWNIWRFRPIKPVD